MTEAAAKALETAVRKGIEMREHQKRFFAHRANVDALKAAKRAEKEFDELAKYALALVGH